MSKSWSGNLFGALISVLGCLVGYGSYRNEYGLGLLVGAGIALLGAAIINPTALKSGAHDFKDSAKDIVDLIPGRRSGDTKEVKIAVKKSKRDDDEGVI